MSALLSAKFSRYAALGPHDATADKDCRGRPVKNLVVPERAAPTHTTEHH